MKKLFLITLALMFVVFAGFAHADNLQTSTSSGEKIIDTQVRTGKSAIASVQLITDGTNAATLTVHDGTANTDKKIGEYKCDGNDYYCGWIWEFPVFIQTGIYADVTGTNASFIIEYFELP